MAGTGQVAVADAGAEANRIYYKQKRCIQQKSSIQGCYRLHGTSWGYPCQLAGRSLRPSWPSLAPCWPRSAILAPLASKAGSIGTGNPSVDGMEFTA